MPSNTNNIYLRFKKVRESMGLSQGAFAEKLNISQGYVSEIERGAKEPSDRIYSLMDYRLDVNLDWLLKGEGEMRKKSSTLNTLAYSTVPVLASVPAGFPNEVNDEVVEYISVPGIEVDAYAIVVNGDSMLPDIKHGDYVFFAITGDIKSGDVVVVKNEYGEAMIKRYKKRERDGEVLLASDNPEYPSFTPNEHYKIMGKVIKVWRNINF